MLKNIKSGFLGTISSVAIGLGVITLSICGVALAAVEADHYWFSGSFTGSLLTAAESAFEEAGPTYTAAVEIVEDDSYSYDFDVSQWNDAVVTEMATVSELEDLEQAQRLMEASMADAQSKMELAMEKALPHLEEATQAVQLRVQSQMERMEKRLESMNEKLQERMDRMGERFR